KRSENSSTQLLIHVSDYGQNWTQLTYARPSGTGTNVWQLINPAGFIPSTSNLRIRFSKGANSWWFRIDDVKLTGDRDENVPVALSSFTAAITNQNFVKLSWTTQSEINVAGYYLYRSTNNELSDALVVSPLIPAQNNPTQQTYSFTDSEIYSHGTYYYWLQNVDLDGTDAYHGPVTVYYNAHNEYYQPEIPQKTELSAAFPNPFNPQVSIPFSLADAAVVNIRVFNSRGQLQKTFDLGFKGAGNYTVTWNGTDLDGQPASSGVYYIIMNTGQDTMTRKAVLLK
ncbi:MAG TPA: FlgD immunoglobulin-like domain containing protein, partial [Candidatus Syntrophosphaera sp.]|nr:FlgD immunoglobulin-like domain containing protein [Candidatus Syntrophosphaera sp.]